MSYSVIPFHSLTALWGGEGLRKLTTEPNSSPELALEIVCNIAPFVAFGMLTRIMEILIFVVRYVDQVSLDPCVYVCVWRSGGIAGSGYADLTDCLLADVPQNAKVGDAWRWMRLSCWHVCRFLTGLY